jgi:hypothetical protein
MQDLFNKITALRAAEQAGLVNTRLFVPQDSKTRGDTLRRALSEKAGMTVHYSTVLNLAIREGLSVLEKEHIHNQIKQ